MGDVLRVEVQAEPTTAEAPKTEQTPTTPSIPEKFKGKSAEEIAQAYIELEKKLGQPKTETPAPSEKKVETPAKAETKVPDSLKPADIQKFETEFAEKGKLSDESYAELQKNHNLTKEQVDQFIAGKQAQAALSAQEIFSAVGGQESYQKMVQWATSNMTPAERQAYNTAVNHSDPNVVKMAVENLESRYTKAFGSAPNLVSGRNDNAVIGFRSHAEVTKAMSDPRYSGKSSEKDSAYIAEVERKIAVSNF